MTEIQKRALEAMDAHDVGAVFSPHSGWIFPEDVREDDQKAVEVLRIYVNDN
jgi:hypothetical protein